MLSISDTFAPMYSDPLDAAFQIAVGTAQANYRMARHMDAMANEYSRQGLTGQARAMREYAAQDRKLGREAVTPFRVWLKIRTEDERRTASRRVARGQVSFLNNACSGDTCDDCERPLWQHIRTSQTRVMCPFGREYWTYARALWAPECDHSHRANGCVLRMVARPRGRTT